MYKTFQVDENTEYKLPNKFLKEINILVDDVQMYDQDLLIVLDGEEGSGKSYFARQIGHYLSQEFGTGFDRTGMDNIHNDRMDYIRSCFNSPPFTVQILDEGRKMLYNRRSMSESNVSFTNFLSECRSQNQIHILCIPAFHDFDKYICLWRMKMLIHMTKTYRKDDDVRSGYRLDIGRYRVFANNKRLKSKFKGKEYTFPKEDIVTARNTSPPTGELLNDEGLERYESQKQKKMREKYLDEEEGGDEGDDEVCTCLFREGELEKSVLTRLRSDSYAGWKSMGRDLGLDVSLIGSRVDRYDLRNRDWSDFSGGTNLLSKEEKHNLLYRLKDKFGEWDEVSKFLGVPRRRLDIYLSSSMGIEA